MPSNKASTLSEILPKLPTTLFIARIFATDSVTVLIFFVIADTSLLSPKAILAVSSVISNAKSAPVITTVAFIKVVAVANPAVQPVKITPPTKPATLQPSLMTVADVSSLLNVSPASLQASAVT